MRCQSVLYAQIYGTQSMLTITMQFLAISTVMSNSLTSLAVPGHGVDYT